MNIKIINIIDPGIPSKERLYMRVAIDDNVGKYVVFDSIQKTPGRVSSSIKNVFWFPDKEVKAGDSVVLYTKSGTNSQVINDNKSTTHFFYWGEENVLWDNQGDCAILLRIEEWEYRTRTNKIS